MALVVKNPLPVLERPGFDPWIRKIPWRRAGQPTPVSLPGESHGQRSLAGCSPWGDAGGKLLRTGTVFLLWVPGSK